MPRIVVRKRIVEVIQEEIIRYECDFCGKTCGTIQNRKITVSSRDGKLYFCIKTDCWAKSHEEKK